MAPMTGFDLSMNCGLREPYTFLAMNDFDGRSGPNNETLEWLTRGIFFIIAVPLGFVLSLPLSLVFAPMGGWGTIAAGTAALVYCRTLWRRRQLWSVIVYGGLGLGGILGGGFFTAIFGRIPCC